MNVVEILQVGFTGFAFLMTGYSFRLLKKAADDRRPFPKSVENLITRFMVLSLAMTVFSLAVVITDLVVDSPAERQVRLMRSSAAQRCMAALRDLSDGAIPSGQGIHDKATEAASRCESVLDDI